MSQKNKDYTLLKLLFSLLTWGSMVFAVIMTSDSLGGNLIPVLLFMGSFLVVINGFVWDWGRSFQDKNQAVDLNAQEEKRKRDMLDSVLRNMSNEQLKALRTRLEDPGFEEDLRDMLGEDSDFVIRKS